jgi:NTE family protein
MSTGRIRVGLILSAGGLRGAGHLGVLRRLLHHEIPIHVVVGVSAGAVVAAYYAAVGLSIEELIQEARNFRGRHLIFHGLGIRAPRFIKPLLARYSGVIPERLRQLELASFDRLHHGVQALGIVCHDLLTNRPVYFASCRKWNASLAELVKCSAALPGIIPPQVVKQAGQLFRLIDGGISDSLPVDFARTPGLEATHLIVSDCRRAVAVGQISDRMIYVRPELNNTGILRAPRSTLLEAVLQGEAAVTDSVVRQIHDWLESS